MSERVRHHHLAGQDDPVLPVTKRGRELISDPMLNKGTGFPDSERDALGLRGLVPPQMVSIDDQVERVMENFRRQSDDLARYSHLESLHDRNETLYYRVLLDHVRELTPIIYTPVVGKACSHFGHIYRKARGMYFSVAERELFPSMVHNWPEDEVDVVVVTDGSRILGLGDLGANGMGIPIGKLSLYVLGAGIYPYRTLPVMLDVGTNNAALRADALYLGERIARVDDERFYATVRDFISAVHARWPRALIQFEDFSNNHAFDLLERWRERILCFNDDIQGTGAVTLAGVLGALKIAGRSLIEERICMLGAGSAARGIADMLVTAMCRQGLSDEQARRRIWMFDSHGLVTADRMPSLAAHKRPYAQPAAGCDKLLELVRRVRPGILIGVSGQPGMFDEPLLREMRRHCERPIVFVLSNPTAKAECTAEQAYTWTDGAALVASGSPFAPVELGGRTLTPGQCNNMYIFPGVGMGVVSCEARRVTNEMFHAAARTLAGMAGDEAIAQGRLYPDLCNIREISARIAVAVCEVAFEQGLAGIEPPDDLDGFVRSRMYQPHYVPYGAA